MTKKQDSSLERRLFAFLDNFLYLHVVGIWMRLKLFFLFFDAATSLADATMRLTTVRILDELRIVGGLFIDTPVLICAIIAHNFIAYTIAPLVRRYKASPKMTLTQHFSVDRCVKLCVLLARC